MNSGQTEQCVTCRHALERMIGIGPRTTMVCDGPYMMGDRVDYRDAARRGKCPGHSPGDPRWIGLK